MKNEMYFARETRNIEKQAEKVEREFLSFVADKLRLADDLSTAEKYTLLTAFVEEFATGGGVVLHSIWEASGADKTASKLADVMHQYDLEFGLEEKREAIREKENTLFEEREAWDKENSPKSPLLPDNK